MRITPELIRKQGQQLQGYRHDAKRSKALAGELEILLGSVAAATGALAFEDEPSHFQVILQRAKSRGWGGST